MTTSECDSHGQTSKIEKARQRPRPGALTRHDVDCTEKQRQGPTEETNTLFFFLNNPPTPEISPLPHHAALPISVRSALPGIPPWAPEGLHPAAPAAESSKATPPATSPAPA